MDLTYQRALTQAGPDQYTEGIHRYENSQREVVLELPRVSLKQIYSWGGYSSPIEHLAECIIGAQPTQDQIDWLRAIIEEHDVAVGPRWTTPAGARNVTLRVLDQARARNFPIPDDPAFLP